MIKKLIFINCIFLCVLFSSCNKNQWDNSISTEDAEIIDLTKMNKYLVESIPVKDVHYIYLETNDEALIGRVKKILIRNDRIYILDHKYAKALFVFNIQGKFLFKLDAQGKAPNEFVNLNDFDIDDAGNIFLHDQAAKKIIKYSDSGEYIEYYNYSFYTSHFKHINDSLFVFQNCNHRNPKMKDIKDYTIYYWNRKSNQVTNVFFPYVHENVESFGGAYFNIFSSDNKVYYIPRYTDLVYELGTNEVHLKYTFKFDHTRMPVDELKEYEFREISSLISEGKLGYFMDNFHETEKFISFMFTKNNIPWIFIQSKETGNIQISKTLPDKLEKREILGETSQYGVYRDRFVTCIQGKALTEYIRQSKTNEDFFVNGYGHLDVFQKLKTLNRDSNPIIVLYDFKEF
jgi:hypothetical protein